MVMASPTNTGSVFYNYKETHSIILMASRTPNKKLLYVDVGRNGQYSDGGVFSRCTFAEAMDNNKLGLPPLHPLPRRETPVLYTLVADDAFSLRPDIMNPYSQRGPDNGAACV